MSNLIKYCIVKGVNNFIRFKFERKSKIVMREHFISNSDVENYNLYLYVHKDKYGRYKLSKYVFRNISHICEVLKNNQTEKCLLYYETQIDKKILKIDKNILKNTQTQRKLKIIKLNKT